MDLGGYAAVSSQFQILHTYDSPHTKCKPYEGCYFKIFKMKATAYDMTALLKMTATAYESYTTKNESYL